MIRAARVSIRLALLIPVLFGLGSVGVVLAVSQLTRNEAGMFFKAAVIMLAIPMPAAWLAIKLAGRGNNQDVTVSSVASSIWQWHETQKECPEHHDPPERDGDVARRRGGARFAKDGCGARAQIHSANRG